GAAGRGILDGEAGTRARISRKGLGESPMKIGSRLEDAHGDASGLVLVTTTSEPKCDDRVVVGPDCAHVVANRVVSAIALGHRPPAPAGEEPFAHQMPHASGNLVVVDNSAPEEVSDVRRQRIDPALFSVESECKILAIWKPEIAIEPFLE